MNIKKNYLIQNIEKSFSQSNFIKLPNQSHLCKPIYYVHGYMTFCKPH